MTSSQLVSLALEVWRASGAKTLERLESLVILYAETSYGRRAEWPQYTREMVERAVDDALGRVRPFEISADVQKRGGR